MIRCVPQLRGTRWGARLCRRFLPVCFLLLLAVPAAHAEEPWQTAFEETCSKTSEAMNLSLPELEALLKSCRDLEKVIETKEESLRKAYLKRLRLCQNLYAYMVEFKKGGEGAK